MKLQVTKEMEIFGIPLKDLMSIGSRYRQNMIVLLDHLNMLLSRKIYHKLIEVKLRGYLSLLIVLS